MTPFPTGLPIARNVAIQDLTPGLPGRRSTRHGQDQGGVQAGTAGSDSVAQCAPPPVQLALTALMSWILRPGNTDW